MVEPTDREKRWRESWKKEKAELEDRILELMRENKKLASAAIDPQPAQREVAMGEYTLFDVAVGRGGDELEFILVRAKCARDALLYVEEKTGGQVFSVEPSDYSDFYVAPEGWESWSKSPGKKEDLPCSAGPANK